MKKQFFCLQDDTILKIKKFRDKLRTKDAKRRYPKTVKGRKNYIQDSLAGTNVTPVWMGAIICFILLPVLIPCLIYAGFKWLYFKIYQP